MHRACKVVMMWLVIALLVIVPGCGRSDSHPSESRTEAEGGGICADIGLKHLSGFKSQEDALSLCAKVKQQCPHAVDWSTASSANGRLITFFGPVVTTSYRPDVQGRPTFINIGAGFPKPERLTLVIWKEHRADFARPPERLFGNKTVCVSGEVTERNGVAQLEIEDSAQVRVLY